MSTDPSSHFHSVQTCLLEKSQDQQWTPDGTVPIQSTLQALHINVLLHPVAFLAYQAILYSQYRSIHLIDIITDVTLYR